MQHIKYKNKKRFSNLKHLLYYSSFNKTLKSLNKSLNTFFRDVGAKNAAGDLRESKAEP